MKRLLALSVAVVLVVPASAGAAAPSPSIGPANSVTSTSAVLNGAVNPNGEATTYHFEYGTTKAYGTATPEQGPTAANKAKVNVSASVGGLTAGATYHYRLVAVNASGTKVTGDRTFKTAAGISLTASRSTITFGGQTILSGRLTAANPGGIKVTLEQDPAPFNVSEFKGATTATTDATGKFTFSQAPTTNTAYRVTTRNPNASSGVVTVHVRLRVTMSLSSTHPKRGRFVTFRGSVTPARNGQLVRIQKLVRRHWRTVTTTIAAASSDPGVSSYKKRLRIRKRGTYRVYVSGDVANRAGASGRRTIRVT